jgi:streptomycin 6-kinase
MTRPPADWSPEPLPEPLPMPRHLVEAAALDRHDRRRDWVARLPGIVAALAERWRLTVGPPFQPGGEGSWTAPVTDAAGRDLVLKVGWTHDEGVHEADALRLWAGRGAVLLHDHHVNGDTTALLLERARPGVELGQSLPEAEQDVVVAGLLRQMWVPPPAGHPFRPLAEMCDLWAAEAEETPPTELDPGLFRAAVELFRGLPREPRSDDDVLLLTDLHGGNILSAQREPWLVIDPKPYVGDRCYDPLQHLFNCLGRVEADPDAMARRITDLCGLDSGRFRLWFFARWVVEASWAQPADQPGLLAVARHLAP